MHDTDTIVEHVAADPLGQEVRDPAQSYVAVPVGVRGLGGTRVVDDADDVGRVIAPTSEWWWNRRAIEVGDTIRPPRRPGDRAYR